MASVRFKELGEQLLMFSHVMIGTNDLEKAKAFYDALLGTLDVRPARSTATASSTSPRPACSR